MSYLKLINYCIVSCLIVSCNSNQRGVPNFTAVTDDKIILGTWSMCAESDNKQMYQYNMCNSIDFNFDGSGYEKFSGGKREEFGWSLKNKQLKIYHNKKGANISFTDTSYFAVFHNKPGRIDMVIIHTKSNQSYYLSKSLQ